MEYPPLDDEPSVRYKARAKIATEGFGSPTNFYIRPTHPGDARLAPYVDSSLLVELAPHDVRVVQLGRLSAVSTHLLGIRQEDIRAVA